MYFRGFSTFCLFRYGQVPVCAHAFEGFFVVDFLFFHAHALIEDIDLFFAQLLSLLVGDFLILIGSRHGFMTLDLKQFQLGIQILLPN